MRKPKFFPRLLTVHPPIAAVPELATNGFLTGRDTDGSWYVCVVHSKRQFTDLVTESGIRLNAEDGAYTRARITGAALPDTADVPPRRLQGRAAETISKAVHGFAEMTEEFVRYMLTTDRPALLVDSGSENGIIDAIAFAGGGRIQPFVEVCYSKEQLRETVRPLCRLMGGEGEWDFQAVKRHVNQHAVPERSHRPSFRIEAYAGTHILAALTHALLVKPTQGEDPPRGSA